MDSFERKRSLKAANPPPMLAHGYPSYGISDLAIR